MDWPTLGLIKVCISLQLLQLVDIGFWLKLFVNVLGLRQSTAVHRVGLGSIPDHMWDLCSTK